MRLIERIWLGESPGGRAVRVLLTPLELLYRGVVALRAELYKRHVITPHSSSIPVVGVGNLTVGGTGKTPVAAWIASRLASAGMSPAVVMRGYGDDEPLVHARLNAAIPVIVAANRAEGIATAAAAGADIAVLDDAFQHRRAARDADIVLVSADDWTGRHRSLPAGPYREPVTALGRATIVLVTRKAVSAERAADVARAIRTMAPGVPVAIARLSLSELVRERPTELRLPPASLAGKRALAIAAVANSTAFFDQLRALGARVTGRPFPDHHRFTATDVAMILDQNETFDYVVCTLKDAVKLAPLWPADGSPLWYVSLAVEAESGGSAIDELLVRLQGHNYVKAT